jgi:drug/metabolite transporter (DMT)-like permease
MSIERIFRNPHFQMHLSIFLWGFTAILGKLITLNESLLVWYRMGITLITLGVYALVMKKPLKVPIKEMLKMSGIGAILAIHWVFFYAAIKYSNVSVTLSTFSSTALFTALLEPMVTGRKIKVSEIILSLIALAGILIITDSAQAYFLGIVLALGATFVGSFFNILNKSIVQKTDSVVVSFYEISTGWVILSFLLPLLLNISHVPFGVPTSMDWIYLSILAVFCTHMTLILSLNALKKLSAFTLNLAINLEPVYGIALAWILFPKDERMDTGFYIGASLVMTSVVMHAWFSMHAQRDASEASASN